MIVRVGMKAISLNGVILRHRERAKTNQRVEQRRSSIEKSLTIFLHHKHAAEPSSATFFRPRARKLPN